MAIRSELAPRQPPESGQTSGGLQREREDDGGGREQEFGLDLTLTPWQKRTLVK